MAKKKKKPVKKVTKPAKRVTKPAKKVTKPIKKVTKPTKRVTKPVPEKDYTLYHANKKLRPIHIDAIEIAAKSRNIDVSTPKKLYNYYEKYKQYFAILFEMGTTSLKMGTNRFINDMNEVTKYSKRYFLDIDGNVKQVTKNQLIWNVVTMESYMNDVLGTTFFQLSYTATFDNTITVSLPSYKEIRDIEEESTEEISDYLLEKYEILVYRNEVADKEESHIKRKETYTKSLKKKLRKVRNEKQADKKGKPERKKRK